MKSNDSSETTGKAGGFLALDWCVGTPLDALARRSFSPALSRSVDCSGRQLLTAPDLNYSSSDAEHEQAKRRAKKTIADFLGSEIAFGFKSPDDQRLELFMLLTAIEFLSDDLLAWAREGSAPDPKQR